MEKVIWSLLSPYWHLSIFANLPPSPFIDQMFNSFNTLKAKYHPIFCKYFYSGVEIRIITFTQAIRHQDSTRYLSTRNAIEVTTSILRTKWTFVMWLEKPNFCPELLWDHAPHSLAPHSSWQLEQKLDSLSLKFRSENIVVLATEMAHNLTILFCLIICLSCVYKMLIG